MLITRLGTTTTTYANNFSRVLAKTYNTSALIIASRLHCHPTRVSSHLEERSWRVPHPMRSLNMFAGL